MGTDLQIGGARLCYRARTEPPFPGAELQPLRQWPYGAIQFPMVEQFTVRTPGIGLHEITDRVAAVVRRTAVESGLCTVFVRHTSASLIIQENADPSAKHDLERWLCRLVREDDPDFTHTMEGPDDMPSHIKAALTATSIAIPVMDGRMALGTWQGIYLWEHRRSPHSRTIVVHVGS